MKHMDFQRFSIILVGSESIGPYVFWIELIGFVDRFTMTAVFMEHYNIHYQQYIQ